MLIRCVCVASLFFSACVDSAAPLPGPACDAPARPEFCKESCPAATCPGQAQSACELECRACAPDVAYCPAPE